MGPVLDEAFALSVINEGAAKSNTSSTARGSARVAEVSAVLTQVDCGDERTGRSSSTFWLMGGFDQGVVAGAAGQLTKLEDVEEFVPRGKNVSR